MPQYAVLPIPPHPPYRAPCRRCKGRGVTGDRFEMPTDTGPTLLIDALCPDCLGCGNGDPDHVGCPDELHADSDLGDDGPVCPSCGSGRGWNPVQGIVSVVDGVEYGDSQSLAILRVPCGCAEGRMVIGDDPAKLDSGPEVAGG